MTDAEDFIALGIQAGGLQIHGQEHQLIDLSAPRRERDAQIVHKWSGGRGAATSAADSPVKTAR